MRLKSKVLIIAGSDSSGGAGIQADIKTVTSLGSYAMTAITAVTTQNTTGVKSIIPIRPKEISNQIEYSAKDIRPQAIKIGMLHSKQVILAVNKSLNKLKIKKIILDPVMVAKGGAKLINPAAILFIKNILMKKVLLITPNIPEAEILSGIKIRSSKDMVHAGRRLIKLGAKNILIKGGHLKSKIMIDILINKKSVKEFPEHPQTIFFFLHYYTHSILTKQVERILIILVQFLIILFLEHFFQRLFYLNLF